MKRIVFFLISLIFYTSLKGQLSYDKIDDHARNFKSRSTDIKELTLGLTAPFTTDVEKARAIYTWITEMISYDIKRSLKSKSQKSGSSTSGKKAQMQSNSIDAAIKVTLQKRKGLSEDYTNLFARMCEIAGVKATIVKGTERLNPRLVGKTTLMDDHQWNAVMIDHKWYIVDATIGAGSVDSEKKKFIKDFKSEFFLIEPSISVMTHFPKDESFQFLPIKLSKEELVKLPILGYGYLKYKVTEYLPKEALIKLIGKSGSTGPQVFIFKIRFSKDPPEKILFIEGTRHIETTAFKSDDGFYYIGFDLKGKSNRIVTIAGEESGVVYEILTYKIG